MIFGRNTNKFKDGDKVHVVHIDGYGLALSEEAYKQLNLSHSEEEVEGIYNMRIHVSKFLPYIYRTPKLEPNER